MGFPSTQQPWFKSSMKGKDQDGWGVRCRTHLLPQTHQKTHLGVPVMVQRKQIQLGPMRLQVWSLTPLCGLGDFWGHVLPFSFTSLSQECLSCPDSFSLSLFFFLLFYPVMSRVSCPFWRFKYSASIHWCSVWVVLHVDVFFWCVLWEKVSVTSYSSAILLLSSYFSTAKENS